MDIRIAVMTTIMRKFMMIMMILILIVKNDDNEEEEEDEDNNDDAHSQPIGTAAMKVLKLKILINVITTRLKKCS